MAKVYMMCGKVGSGKTTYAMTLSDEVGGVVLSVDEWMLTAYGREVPCSEHKAHVDRIKEGLYRDAHKILSRGVPVILDFGYWTKEERAEVIVAFEGYEVKLIYMDVPEEILYQRVAARNKAGRALDYYMTKETHQALNSRFEVPLEDEAPTVIKP